MSRENDEVILRSIDALNARDFAAAAGALHPDVLWQPFLSLSEGPLSGRAAVQQHWEDISDNMASWRLTANEIKSCGDDVYLELHSEIKGRVSGAGMAAVLFAHVRFRDGQIAEFRWFRTPGEAFEAAGLPEGELKPAE